MGRCRDSGLQAHPFIISVTCVSTSLHSRVDLGKFHIHKTMSLELTHECFFSSSVGLAVLSHTLTPRMKASHVALQTMRGHLDAVYDITVAYEGSLDSSRQRKPAPSMPGKHFIRSVLEPSVLDLVVSYFFRGPLSVEAVCHPVLVSPVSSKHFCPFMTPFLLFYSQLAGSAVVKNNLLSWPPHCE